MSLNDKLKQKNEVVLTGAAGTGKTTAIKELLSTWEHGYTLLAPTGRAARRLSEVTGKSASTIHSAIFNPPEEGEDGEPIFKKVRRMGGRTHLVVVDEASMIGDYLYSAIHRAVLPGTRILFVGDGNQVLPIGEATAIDWSKPDIKLTTIHRSENGIAQFCNAILGLSSKEEFYKLLNEVKLNSYLGVSIKDIRAELPSVWKATSLDRMLIVPTNALRLVVNDAVRIRRNFPKGVAVVGDHLLVRSNNQKTNLWNGTLVEIQQFHTEDSEVPEHYREITGINENNESFRCFVVPDEFQADATTFRISRREDSKEWKRRLASREIVGARWTPELDFIADKYLVGPAANSLHVNYGYALTIHAAQGGEANEVGIIWDAFWMLDKNFDAAKRLFYTAASRAKNSLSIWLKT